MGAMDSMMDTMIKGLPQEKREEMMINMMPLMMEGIDMNELYLFSVQRVSHQVAHWTE
jgi:radical SAM superfamily enzyme